MKKKIGLIGVFLIFSVISNAGTQSGFEFLKTLFGARPAAMGGAFVGGYGDIMVVGYNPAGLAGLKNSMALFTYLNYFADFQGGFIGYGRMLSEKHNIATGIAYMNYGNIDWTDVTGTHTGSSAPGDFLFHTTYAGKSELGICYGVTVKYIRSQIEHYSADAVAMDAGLFYRIEKEQMNIGLSISNLGQALTAYVNHKEKLPTAYRIGFSKTLAHLPLTLHFQITRFHYEGSDLFLGIYWALGGEFQISEHMYLRWGYNSVGREQKVNSDKDRFTGISLGFGTMVNRLMIDYALSYHGILGSTHQFTVYMTL